MFKYVAALFFLVAAFFGKAQDFAHKQIIQNRENSDWAQDQPYVILLSIDGFRYDYAEKFGAVNILKLKETGVSARKMWPAFPTKTFPNHYTIATGLHPGNHGLVGNEFYSRSKKSWYKVRDKSAVTDSSWYDGIPIWSLAEQQGMLSASFFWVGSEAEISGYRPNYNYAYDARIPDSFRLNQIINWLGLPAEKRPHMILGYFSGVDDAGHRYGPDHENTRSAVLKIDSLFGAFLRELQRIDLPVHVILVSDHGMSAINRGIVLSDLTDLSDSKVSYSIPPMIYQKDSLKVEKMYQDLLQSGLIDVYKKSNLPGHFNFENMDRVGDLVLLTRPPTIVLEEPMLVYGGTHGFDPFEDNEMGAIFYAKGPLLRQGLMLAPFESIHVFPFIAKILNLQSPEAIDGSIEFLMPAFQ